MSGTIDRRGVSRGRQAGIVVGIFLIVGVIMDYANHWHYLHIILHNVH